MQIGDTFTQDGVTYIVKGMDGAGRPVSSCKPEDIKNYAKAEYKQTELPFETVPNPTKKTARSRRK